MLLRSLGLKLLLMCLLVLSVAIGLMALFNSQATSGEFVRYLDTKSQQDQVMTRQLLDAYKLDPNSAAIKNLVEKMALASGRRIIFTDKNQRVVVDSSGELTGQQWEGPQLPDGLTKPTDIHISGKSSQAQPVEKPGIAIVSTPADFLIPGSVDAQMAASTDGQLTMIISAATMGPTFGVVANSITSVYGPVFSTQAAGPEKSFITSVNHSQLLAIVLAGLVALALAVFLSRQILRPVRALTLAARQLEKGNLSQRVKVKAHDEIGKLGHAFNPMADRLDRPEHLRRNMVGDVAHELRTPLTNISGYLEALQDGVVRPSPEMFASLYEEARLLNRLVSDLQELAQAEAGQLKLSLRQVDPYAVITGAVAAVKNLAAVKGVTLCVEAPPDLPAVVADPERLGQILRNLLNNAIQHTPERGRITVRAHVSGATLEIMVQDTGVGIAPEHLPYLFERFYRVDKARARATGGSGLGLAIVKQLVEAHGGQVSVSSQPGRGTQFSFVLNRASQIEELAGSRTLVRVA